MVDVLFLNTLVTDIRFSLGMSFPDIDFVEPGVLVRRRLHDFPIIDNKDLERLIKSATIGGPGNAAPLLQKTGLHTAVAGYLGAGEYDGWDLQGKFFIDSMRKYEIDTTFVNSLTDHPSATTFISQSNEHERAGLAFNSGAGDYFDFELARKAVTYLKPRIVYYMYLGLSDSGDANEGNDLAKFMKYCKSLGIITIADTHTFDDPDNLGRINPYESLENVLPTLDIFFSSIDEAKLISSALNIIVSETSEERFVNDYLRGLTAYSGDHTGTQLLGVTVKDGAYITCKTEEGWSAPIKIKSKFMSDEVVDLVGAGDAFRAGLLAYVSRNTESFKDATINFEEAVQMGNLFASLYIKAPLEDRYENFRDYTSMLKMVHS